MGSEMCIRDSSVTGRDLARGWGSDARLAPFDAPGATARFLAAVRPRAQVTVEGESVSYTHLTLPTKRIV